MNVIAFAPKYNTPGKKDATGAFQPEAKRFLKYHQVSINNHLTLFDNHQSKSKMSFEVMDTIDAYRNLQGIAFFCHGSKSGIQCGFDNKNVSDLASAIHDANIISTVPLYACDTGRNLDKDRIDDLEKFGGDGGFADQLRDALCRAGSVLCRVDAHTTAGHTSINPNVRRFEGQGSPNGCVGGYYIVPFGSKFWKKWRIALRTDFRYRFPFMTAVEIQDYLTFCVKT